MKILYVASEARPFVKTGGLGDVMGALPKTVASMKNDCRVIIPLYEEIPQEYRQTMRFVGSTYVDLSWRRQYLGVFNIRWTTSFITLSTTNTTSKGKDFTVISTTAKDLRFSAKRFSKRAR